MAYHLLDTIVTNRVMGGRGAAEQKDIHIMKLVRVVAPHFVAGFETDGVVRRAAPILKHLIGKSDDYARETIRRYGWKASVIDDGTGAKQTR
jgi:hypothetical protein